MPDDPAPATEPLFRPSKRRRIGRVKRDEDEDEEAPTAPSDRQHAVADVHETEETAPTKSVIRQRKPKTGIAFSNSTLPRVAHDGDNGQGQALVAVPDAVEIAHSRFMAPTGQVAATDDKHMMAYIDSKMARIRSTNTTSSTSLPETDIATLDPSPLVGAHAFAPSDLTPYTTEQAASSGATTPAMREPARSLIQPQPKKPRLGRDGKPLRPRKDRERRTSTDLARDAMVEAILSETRLDIYEEQPVRQVRTADGQDEEADARMAAEFRRQFIAAQEERKTRRPAPPPAGKGEPVLRGPKLGGSRSQRAAMHAALQEQAQKSGKMTK